MVCQMQRVKDGELGHVGNVSRSGCAGTASV